MASGFNNSRTIVLEEPGRFIERVFRIPEIGADEFLIRVDMVTICGGDLIEYRGENRKAHYPLLMGHELVGTVQTIGQTAAIRHGVEVGDKVMVEPYIRCGQCEYCLRGAYHFCEAGMVYGVTISCDRPPHLWGAYSQYLYGAPGARVHRLSPSVSDQAGCMVTVLGNGVRWVRTRGQMRIGENVLITGLGVQALASVAVARAAGAQQVVVACREEFGPRLQLARDLGATHIVAVDDIPAGTADMAAIRKIVGVTGGGPELAVECTGAEPMMSLAVSALKPSGRIVAAGTRGGRPLSLDLDEVVFKEVTILGGLGQAGDTELAAALVNSGELPIERMVSHVFPLGDAAKALELMMEGRDEVVHIGLDPWS
ncbi:MAG: zinc-binding dehydrogenase [Actinomycetota bacterium]|nr:zinc-binding dehydrogenase [Actinomycetota bacterium]